MAKVYFTVRSANIDYNVNVANKFSVQADWTRAVDNSNGIARFSWNPTDSAATILAAAKSAVASASGESTSDVFAVFEFVPFGSCVTISA